MIKKFMKVLFISGAIFTIATGFTSKKELKASNVINSEVREGLGLYYTVLSKNEVEEEVKEEFSLFLGKSFIGFKEAVGFKESQGRYSVINTFGYMGKYQFGKGTLKLIGVYNTRSFIKDPNIQEKAFEANLSRNKWVLRRDIKRFVGRTIGGVKITESGILAAAHLGGPGNVKKYLRSYGANVFSDAYGSSVRYYMKKFAGFDTSSVEENKKAKVVLG
ncbi:MAG: hypothetical protein HRT69_08320 [Flavobacteriaceae bacterium]|nr:hypothetical protein [Flavobacteriaceae bacterium]